MDKPEAKVLRKVSENKSLENREVNSKYDEYYEEEEEEEKLPVNWDEFYRKDKTKIINGKEYQLFKKAFIERLSFKDDHCMRHQMEKDMNSSYDSDEIY